MNNNDLKYKSKTHKVDYSIIIEISIGQHSRDKLLMNSLKETLKCDIVFEHS